ncbi:alpha-L-fucosidase [Halosquirtibacter xylanolyticus]|uniref:alpha-L-fucosidase n=1 Tax=Halosquirtibacter xylanolyticus TaxID=3374599 RepID=UPI003749E0AF|nr:alpha-L-fucosidase [Prolixibacteraceae bacterium]
MKLTFNTFLILLITVCGYSCVQKETKERSIPFKEEWSDLAKHKNNLEWFKDSKLGIYFHWGVYSVPEHGSEWYPFFLYQRNNNGVIKYHTKHYGAPDKFNYHDFIPMFKASQFDANEWAGLFKTAGAKFAGLVAIHHDGFAMWDSKVNPWNSKDKGPHKDIVGDMAKALRKNDMKLITTFHHARNRQRHEGDSTKWFNYNSHFAYHPDYATSSTDPDTAKFYGNLPEEQFDEYWFQQIKEVTDQYSPDIIWFDSWLNLIPDAYRRKAVAYFFNKSKEKNPDALIISKQNDLPHGIGVLDIEQGGKKDLSESVWLSDFTLSKNSWCYVKGQKYKSATLIVRNMIDVWSKNGIVLLNISPTADGVIPQEQREVLTTMGEWMHANAEAVYETRPFDYSGFGTAKAEDGHFGGQSSTVKYTKDDGRFLISKDRKTLYLFMLGKPDVNSEIEIRGLAKHDYFPENGIKKITVLGDNTPVKWHMALRNFILTVPDSKMNDIATVFKFELN